MSKYYDQYRELKRTIIFFVFWIGLIIILCSCSSAKKSQYEVHKKDSTIVEAVNNLSKKELEGKVVSNSRVITEGNTTIEFEDDEQGGVYVPGDELIDTNDYKPVKRNTIELPGGVKISTNQKIKGITTKEVKQADDSTVSTIKETTTDAENSTKSAQVSVTDEKGSSSKFSINLWGIAFSLFILIVIVIAIRKFLK